LLVLLFTRPASPPLPYTTLFRSRADGRFVQCGLICKNAITGQDVAILPVIVKYSHNGCIARCIETEEVNTARNDHWIRNAHRNRSEEHTSELQSPDHLVCRLLLE